MVTIQECPKCNAPGFIVTEESFSEAENFIECDYCDLMLSSVDSPVTYEQPEAPAPCNDQPVQSPKWYLASWRVGGNSLGDSTTVSVYASRDEVKFYKWMNATRPGEWKTEIDAAEAIRLLQSGHEANRSTKNLLAELL